MNKPDDDKPVGDAAPAAARGLAIWEIGLLVMTVLLLVAGFLFEYDRLGNAAARQFDLKGRVLAQYTSARLQQASALAAQLQAAGTAGRAVLAGARDGDGAWTLALPAGASLPGGVATGAGRAADAPAREVNAALALEAEAGRLLAGDADVAAVWYLSPRHFLYRRARVAEDRLAWADSLYAQPAWTLAESARAAGDKPYLTGGDGARVRVVAPLPAGEAPAGIVGLELEAEALKALLDTQGVIGEAMLVDARGQLVVREDDGLPDDDVALPAAGLNHWTDGDNTTWSALALGDGRLWLLYRVTLREQLGSALAHAVPPGLLLVLVALLVILVLRHREAMDKVAQHERRDGLTHAPNRIGLFEEAVPLRAVARRNRKPLAVLVLDVDYFRQLNEQFGHEAGDKVLKAIYAGLAEKVREYDLVVRWSGEVFVVLLMVEAEADAYLVAERLRSLAAAACHRDALLKVTVSAGLVMLPPEEALEAAIRRGEEMLFAAKAGGRDRLVAGPEVIRPGTPAAAAAEAAAPAVAPTADAVGAPAHLQVEAITASAPPEGAPDPLDPGAAYRQR